MLPDIKEIKDKGKGKKSSSTNNAVVEEPLNESDSIILESFQIGHFAINKLINELNPKYFVLYDCDISIGKMHALTIWQFHEFFVTKEIHDCLLLKTKKFVKFGQLCMKF